MAEQGLHDFQKEALMEEVQEITASTATQLQQGIEFFEAEKYIQAIEIFAMVIAVTNDDLARQYLARCYFRLELYDVAYQHYQYIGEHSTGKYQRYGISMVAVIEGIWGNYDKALELYKSLPSTTNNLINLSIAYWKKYTVSEDYTCLTSAMEILDQIDLTELKDYFRRRIYHVKALVYQSQKEYELAEEYYQKALQLADKGLERGQILNDYGSLFIDLQDYERAQKLLLSARTHIDTKSKMEIAENNRWLQKLATRQIEEGKQYYQAGKYVEAIQVFSSIIGKTNRGLVQKYLGRCYFWLENYEAAYRNFLFLSEQGTGDDKDYGASMVAVIMDEIWGQTDQAIELLESLAPTPRNAVNLLVLYWKKFDLQNEPAYLEKAYRLLEQINEEEVPHFTLSKLYHIKGLVYQNDKNYSQSLLCYERALELVENDLLRGQILNDLASLYISSKRFAEAENVLLEAQSLIAGSSERIREEHRAWLNILQEKQIEEGKRLFVAGEYDQAVEIFSRKYQENSTSRLYLARCYFRMENLSEALQQFESLSNYTEYRSYAVIMQAVIYSIWGEHTTALKTMKQLSETAINQIHKMYLLLYIYKATNQESTLVDAERVMKKTSLLEVEQTVRWRFHLASGMIHQALGQYFLARGQYDEGLKHVGGTLEQAKILNELGSLLLEENYLNQAEEVLKEAHQKLQGQRSIELGINYKLLGLLHKSRKNYEQAHDYFKEALKILREKEAYREAAEVNCLLINENKADFYVSAEYYATLLEYERSLKVIQKENEKVISILEEYLS